jgi:hypothetical protein
MCDVVSGRCVARPPAVGNACTFGAPGIAGDGIGQGLGQGVCLPTNFCEGGDFLRASANSPPTFAAWNFLNLANLFAARDNFRYAPVDISQLIRVLKDSTATASLKDRLAAADPNAILNTASINYLGQSLGGFNGAMASAVNPDLRNLGLNVPGSDQVQVLLTAPGFAAVRAGFLGSLAPLGLRPGVPGFDQFVVLAKTIFDPADPQNALHAGLNASVPAARRIYVQYIVGDEVIPNATTVQLLNAGNRGTRQALQTVFTPDATFPTNERHGFLLRPSQTSAANGLFTQIAQQEMAKFLGTPLAPITTYP